MWFDDLTIWEEVERMAAEAQRSGGKLTIGGSIYQQAALCIPPARLRRPEADELLLSWRYSKALGVPVAPTVDETPALYADAALILAQEEQAAFAFARSRPQ